MSPSLKLHSIWALAALATFAIGYQWASSHPSPTPAAADVSSRSILAIEAAKSASPLGAGLSGDPNSPSNANLSAISRILSADQLASMAKAAFNDPNPVNRNLAFSKLLESLTAENAAEILEVMKSNDPSGDQWNLFLYAWGNADGTAALAHADTLEGRQKDRFLSGMLPGWANKDPNAAIAFLATQPEGRETDRLRYSLVSGLADRDINLATTYAMQRADAGDKQASAYLQQIASEELRKNGPAAAAAWGASLKDGPLKGAALDRIANSYANKDPQAAAAWATQYATTDYGSRVIGEIGDEWAGRDPKAAVAWLESLTDGDAKSMGTYSALRQWTRNDAMAASQYLATLPTSSAKDYAISGFARSLVRSDPESAMIWSQTIADEPARLKAVTRTGQEWFSRDPKSAAAWLQNANLPQNAIQAIIKNPANSRTRG